MASQIPQLAGGRRSIQILYRSAFGVGVVALFGSLAVGAVEGVRESSGLPHGALAYSRVARRALEAGDVERARAESWAAFRVNPSDVQSGLLYVQLLSQGGREADALEAAREVAARSGDASARVRYALLLVAKGRVEEAGAILSRVVAVDERDAVALVYLGDVRALEGDYAAAVALYEEALAIDPSLAEVRDRLRAARRHAETAR